MAQQKKTSDPQAKGTKVKKRMGRPPKPDKDPGFRMAFKVENHLWESFEEWSEIYEKVEKKPKSPRVVAKAMLIAIVDHLDEKLANGEIDPDDPECYLP